MTNAPTAVAPLPPRDPDRQILTYSALHMFRTCPMKYHLRYDLQIAPKETDEDMDFGTLIHKCQADWYSLPNEMPADRKQEIVLKTFDLVIEQAGNDPKARQRAIMGKAMMISYMRLYAVESFRVHSIEKVWTGQIINPDTNATSRTFTRAGKMDGVVIMDLPGEPFYLLEHKTAARVDAAYIKKLWCDTQIRFYADGLRENGIPIAGVLYNILVKTRLEQHEGETEEEFQIRYTELCAKNRSGKSSAKRQLPETDEEFMARLLEWYEQPSAFHREEILITQDALDAVRDEVWTMTQEYLWSRRRGKYPMRRNSCFFYSKECPYFNLCSSNFDEGIRDNFYCHKAVHDELGILPAEPVPTSYPETPERIVQTDDWWRF